MSSEALAKFVQTIPFAQKIANGLGNMVLFRRVIQLEKKMTSMEEEARERSRELARYSYYLSFDYIYSSKVKVREFCLFLKHEKIFKMKSFYFCNSHALTVFNLFIFCFYVPIGLK